MASMHQNPQASAGAPERLTGVQQQQRVEHAVFSRLGG